MYYPYNYYSSGKYYPYEEQSRVDVLPVSLTVAKAYLSIAVLDTSNDALITSLLKAARDFFEGLTNRSLTEITYKTYRDNFRNRCFEIRKKPLISVTSVKYYDEDDTLQTINNANYYTQFTSGYSFIVFKDNFSIPSLSDDIGWPIEIIFKSGYTNSADNLPEDIANGLKAHVAYMFENRGDCSGSVSTDIGVLPILTKLAVRKYKIQEIGF